MNNTILERPLNILNNADRQISNPCITNDSSLILNIISGLRIEGNIQKQPKIAKNKTQAEEKERMSFEEKLKKRQGRLIVKLQRKPKELIFHIEKSKAKLIQKAKLNKKMKKKLLRKMKMKIKTQRKNETKKPVEKQEEKLKLNSLLKNALNEKKPKEIPFYLMTVKYKSVLNYSFLATFSKNNVINLISIELERFMNLRMKEIFIKNLAFLNENSMLRSYLRFNTICAFNEMGEIGTKFKKLSGFLSFAKIGVQFLIIKNDYFTNKTLILFHKDSFPFKNLFTENDFYIIKMDKEFLSVDYFENKERIERTSTRFQYVPEAELILNRWESRVNMKAEMAKELKAPRRTGSLKKNNQMCSSIDICFRRRKARKLEAKENHTNKEQNEFRTRAMSERRHFTENSAIGNYNNNYYYENNLNFNNNEINNYNYNNDCGINAQNLFDSRFIEKWLSLNHLLLNNANASNNEIPNSQFNSETKLKSNKNRSELYSQSPSNSGNLENSTKTESKEDQQEVTPFDARKANSKVIINLHSYEVINNIQDTYSNNQWINYQEKSAILNHKGINNKINEKREEEDLEDGNYNINAY